MLNAFNYYFGPPAHPQLLDHYTEHHAATLHFPDAYKGTSVRIRDTITNLITENVQNFLTTVIAPWRRQDNPNISWDEHVFDVRMLQVGSQTIGPGRTTRRRSSTRPSPPPPPSSGPDSLALAHRVRSPFPTKASRGTKRRSRARTPAR